MENLDNKQYFLHFSGSYKNGKTILPASLPIYYNSIGLGLDFSPSKESHNSLGGDSRLVQYLDCGICKNELDDPIMLNCFHSFCSNCVATRVLDNEIACYSCK